MRRCYCSKFKTAKRGFRKIKISDKISDNRLIGWFFMFNSHLFQVFLHPSFGACAPPSPDLTFSTYALLRRVGRLFAFRFTCFTTESVPTWRTLCKFLLDLGEMPQPRLIVIPIRSKRSEVSPLGGVKRVEK